jgi:uncharacterized membrane protein
MERRHEPTRLEGFSDAVFGFALTLLVVSLELPESTEKLLELMMTFAPVGLMFAMICWIWYEHQKFFRHYGLQDAWTVTINCFLLFVILFYVYPMKFLTLGLYHLSIGAATPGTGMDARSDIVMLLYSSGVILIFGSFVLMYNNAWRKRKALGLTLAEETTLHFNQRGHVISMGLGIASIAIVLIGRKIHYQQAPFFAGVIYALMGPLHGWNGYSAGKAHAILKKKTAESDAKR